MDADGYKIIAWFAILMFAGFTLSTCTDMIRGVPRGTTFIEGLNRDSNY